MMRRGPRPPVAPEIGSPGLALTREGLAAPPPARQEGRGQTRGTSLSCVSAGAWLLTPCPRLSGLAPFPVFGALGNPRRKPLERVRRAGTHAALGRTPRTSSTPQFHNELELGVRAEMRIGEKGNSPLGWYSLGKALVDPCDTDICPFTRKEPETQGSRQGHKNT